MSDPTPAGKAPCTHCDGTGLVADSPHWQDGFTDCLYCEDGYVDAPGAGPAPACPEAYAWMVKDEMAYYGDSFDKVMIRERPYLSETHGWMVYTTPMGGGVWLVDCKSLRKDPPPSEVDTLRAQLEAAQQRNAVLEDLVNQYDSVQKRDYQEYHKSLTELKAYCDRQSDEIHTLRNVTMSKVWSAKLAAELERDQAQQRVAELTAEVERLNNLLQASEHLPPVVPCARCSGEGKTTTGENCSRCGGAGIVSKAESRLAALEAEREQLRSLLAEARPVVAKAKDLPSHSDMERFWREGFVEGPWITYADEFVSTLPALLALIEKVEEALKDG
jgi:hypothetical protein